MKMWALWWKWCDGSGGGVALVFKWKAMAELHLGLMKEHSDKQWFISEVDYIDYDNSPD